MSKITSEYISLECIKSKFEELKNLKFENSDNEIMHFITLTLKENKKRIPVFCRKYKNTLSLKQLAFDEWIHRIERYKTIDNLDMYVTQVYEDCFV